MSATYYKFAGVSTHQGRTEVKYANSLARRRVLEYHGHTNVRFVEMPYAGRVEDCVNHLLSLEEFARLPSVLAEARKLGFRV
jgi:hypothetical protein